MLLAAFSHVVFIGKLSMSELVKPQDRISEWRGCEVFPFPLWASSTRQIPSPDTWFRRGAAPNTESSRVRSEQNLILAPGVTVAVP